MFLQRSACLRSRIDGLRFWLPQWGNCGHISDVQKGVHIFHIGMLRSIKIQHILFMYELWKRNWWNQSNNPLWFQSNLRFNTYRVDKSGKNAIYILKVILSRWNYNFCFWFRKNHGWRKFNFLWRTKYKGALFKQKADYLQFVQRTVRSLKTTHGRLLALTMRKTRVVSGLQNSHS